MPIVWIYHEPLGCLTEATGLSLEQFLTAPNWQALREDCNQFCLEKISGLGRPVLLLGGHSDIVNCDRPNITVGASSWQKFLAQQANMPVDQGSVFVKMQDGGDFFFNLCWGAEVIHRTMHQHPNIEPTVTLVNAVWDVFFFWKELEKANLFCDVHPNIRANQEFAKKVFPEIENFLADAK